MEKRLMLNLVLPLSAAFLVSVAMHRLLNWDGFFLNLSVTLLGIAITVFYVDWVLRQHEAARLAPVDERLRNRTLGLANGCITAVRTSLGFPIGILNLPDGPLHTDPALVSAELVRVARVLLGPSAPYQAAMLDRAGWKNLDRQMRFIHEVAEKHLQLFGQRLEPAMFALIVDIQEMAASISFTYLTWPDILGVPDEELPLKRNGESSVPHKWGLSEAVGIQLQRICLLAAELSELARGVPTSSPLA